VKRKEKLTRNQLKKRKKRFFETMSGRGKGRGGQGKPQPKSTHNHTPNKEVKKTLTDWYYHLGSAKHASGYQATTNFLINHIKQEFEYGIDIAMAMADAKPLTTEDWKPTLQKSNSTDFKTKELENKQYKMEF
jgi:hypothetical protein